MGELLINGSQKSKWISSIKEKVIEIHENRSFGSYIPGTEAGDQAAQFYANLVVEGQKKGGVKGFFMQAADWPGGVLASLWTPDTAVSTTVTLVTSGLGAAESVGRLGAASLPVLKRLGVIGSFQGGLSGGQAITGYDLEREKLSMGARIMHGVAGAITILSLVKFPNSYLFGRSKTPGGTGVFNKGPVRVGYSFRSPKLPGGGEEYFALHGGGKFKGINQGPHWDVWISN